MEYVYLGAGWVASNVLALGVGGVVGYLFGDRVVGLVKGLVAKVV